jgi:hypothetical protein
MVSDEFLEQPLKSWLEEVLQIAREKGFTPLTSRSQIGKVVKWNIPCSPRVRKLLIDAVVETLSKQ